MSTAAKKWVKPRIERVAITDPRVDVMLDHLIRNFGPDDPRVHLVLEKRRAIQDEAFGEELPAARRASK